MSLESLSELCIQSLVRNKDQFSIIGNIQFRLIKPYLKRININVNQLMKYEKYNVEWIFDDDEFWYEFLQTDFPTNIHEQYINKKDKIVGYYKDSLRSLEEMRLDPRLVDNDPILPIILKNRIHESIKRNAESHKYKVPYRMLYLQYQDDIKRKEEQVAANLRLQMQKIREEREQKSTVTVAGEKFFTENTKRRRGGMILPYKPPVSTQSDIKRRHVDRVAFDGMAGRKLDPGSFKVVSRASPPPITQSPILNRNVAESKSSVAPSSQLRASNPAIPKSPTQLIRRTAREMSSTSSSGQNIFLNKRRKPINNRSSPTKAREVQPNAILANRASSHPLGTKRKQSNIFQSHGPAITATTTATTVPSIPRATPASQPNSQHYPSNTNESNTTTSSHDRRYHPRSLSDYLTTMRRSNSRK